MAAILRSGKFLRLFSGVARNLAATGGKNDDTGLVPQHGLSFDRNFSQANFSIQNVLPYLGVSDSGHAEDRFPTRLLSTPSRYLGRVSKEEIELMISEIEVTEPDIKTGTLNLLSSQALLAISQALATLPSLHSSGCDQSTACLPCPYQHHPLTADGRVNGGLNLSRAIGDHAYKQNKSLSLPEQMISPQPDIRTHEIDPEKDSWMILACDGIWNFMSSQEVVDYVQQKIDNTPTNKLSSICEELFEHCHGHDNMTAVIVKFKQDFKLIKDHIGSGQENGKTPV